MNFYDNKCLTFNSLLLVIFVVFSPSVMSENLTSGEVEKEIIEQFKEYRDGVATHMKAKELRKYFSQKINDYWLDLLIESDSLERTLEITRAVKYRLRFGWWVTNIYEWSVIHKNDDTWTMTIIYNTNAKEEKSTYEIDYTLVSGKWLIDRVLNDTTRPDQNYSKETITQFHKIIEY